MPRIIFDSANLQNAVKTGTRPDPTVPRIHRADSLNTARRQYLGEPEGYFHLTDATSYDTDGNPVGDFVIQSAEGTFDGRSYTAQTLTIPAATTGTLYISFVGYQNVVSGTSSGALIASRTGCFSNIFPMLYLGYVQIASGKINVYSQNLGRSPLYGANAKTPIYCQFFATLTGDYDAPFSVSVAIDGLIYNGQSISGGTFSVPASSNTQYVTCTITPLMAAVDVTPTVTFAVSTSTAGTTLTLVSLVQTGYGLNVESQMASPYIFSFAYVPVNT